MIKLLKNAEVYAPEKLGKKDLLIEGEKVLLMQDTIEGYEGLPGVETYDLEEKSLHRLTLICTYTSPEAAVSRDRLPVCRNLSSANFSRTESPR